MRALPPLPDRTAASRMVASWAVEDPKLRDLLGAGVEAGEAVARWGVALLRANRPADAASALRAALALSSETPALWTHLGIALDRIGSLDDAIACFERSVDLERRQPDTWLLVGLAKKRAGDREGARVAYRVALKLEPDSALVWQCLGTLEEEHREYAAAIDCFEACVRLEPPTAALSANLGKLYYEVGRIGDACASYARATALDASNAHYALMARRSAFLRDVIEGASVDDALLAYQVGETPADGGAPHSRNLDGLLESACAHAAAFGNLDAAVQIAQARVERWPESATARYLLRALTRDPALDRSPREYIVESFDAFAEGFDAKLVDVLGYDVPEKLVTLAAAAPGPFTAPYPRRFESVLDAGCGTGLCGPLLRPLTRELVGVDLSPKMLERARARGVYDALACEDLLTFLGRSAARYDLVVAADVVIYFGALAELFTVAAAALREGGVFAFSTERADDAFRLLPSGRFGHAPAYVRDAASSLFTEEACEDTTIRLEGNRRVPGNLYQLRRR